MPCHLAAPERRPTPTPHPPHGRSAPTAPLPMPDPVSPLAGAAAASRRSKRRRGHYRKSRPATTFLFAGAPPTGAMPTPVACPAVIQSPSPTVPHARHLAPLPDLPSPTTPPRSPSGITAGEPPEPSPSSSSPIEFPSCRLPRHRRSSSSILFPLPRSPTFLCRAEFNHPVPGPVPPCATFRRAVPSSSVTRAVPISSTPTGPSHLPCRALPLLRAEFLCRATLFFTEPCRPPTTVPSPSCVMLPSRRNHLHARCSLVPCLP